MDPWSMRWYFPLSLFALCQGSVTLQIPPQTLPTPLPKLSSAASSTRNWILRPPPIPWHNPSQHSRKKDLHHRHLLCSMHTSWQVLCFSAAFVISRVQYLPNLDCIFRRRVHQSVIHHFVHSKWVGNWPLDSMVKLQFNLSDLLVSCCRKRVMDGGPIVSEAASL